MDSTSVSLLHRLRDTSDQSAWERFVELYAPLIYHWARDQGMKATDAADLVQDVLSMLVIKLPQFEYNPRQRFRGWLKTITVNRVRDAYRHIAAAPRQESGESLEHLAAAPSADLLEETEYQSYLAKRALELMRAEFRDDIWQACWKQTVEGQTAAEVANELQMTLNTAYLAKSRVLHRLREELAGLMD